MLNLCDRFSYMANCFLAYSDTITQSGSMENVVCNLQQVGLTFFESSKFQF